MGFMMGKELVWLGIWGGEVHHWGIFILMADSGSLAAIEVFRSTRGEHKARVQHVVDQMKERPEGKRLSIRKTNSHSHTPHSKAFKKHTHQVNVSSLCNVLEVNEEELIAVAEGGCTIESLVNATFPGGFLPQVVPEIRDFTLAGLVNGLGIETSSHLYGGFVETVCAIEVVLADGRVVLCSEEEESELFFALQGAYGTLGVVTGVAVRLMRAKPFVRNEYILFRSLSAYGKAIREAIASDEHSFVEGFVFSRTEAVLLLSRFSDEKEERGGGADEDEDVGLAGELCVLGEEYHFDPKKEGYPWAHQHVRELAWRGDWVAWWSGGGKGSGEFGSWWSRRARIGDAQVAVCRARSDVMNTIDYLFRSERGWLWTLEAFTGAPGLTNLGWILPLEVTTFLEATIGSSSFTRAAQWSPIRTLLERIAAAEYKALDPVMGFAGGSALNPKWTPSDLERCFVQQDSIWDAENIEFGVEWIADNLGVWPLWHCPAVVRGRRGTFTGALNPQRPRPCYIIDCGVYGEPTAPIWSHRHSVRALQRMNDAPTFFGNVHLSPKDLEDKFDMAAYRAARIKYGASEAFAPIEDKVLFYDPNEPSLPKIPAWRLVRTGLLTPVVVGMAVGSVTVLGLLLSNKKHRKMMERTYKAVTFGTSATLATASAITSNNSTFLIDALAASFAGTATAVVAAIATKYLLK